MKKAAILLALFCMLTVTASAAYIPEDVILNEFADVEYTDADGDGGYQEEIREDISKRTGVDASQIEIE